MHFIPIQNFSQQYTGNKKERNYSNCSVSAKFFPMLEKTPSFGGVINQKTYLNHEIDSNFFPSVVLHIN